MYKVKELYYINEASSCHQKHPTQNQGKADGERGRGRDILKSFWTKVHFLSEKSSCGIWNLTKVHVTLIENDIN